MNIIANRSVAGHQRLDRCDTAPLGEVHPLDTCVGPSPTQPDDTILWARAVVEMPAWVFATAYDYTIDQAARIKAVIGDLLVDLEAGR